MPFPGSQKPTDPPSNVNEYCPRKYSFELANCTTPNSGQYKAILSHCKGRQTEKVNGVMTEKCWIDREVFMKLRVCNDLLGQQCEVCRTGCSCKYMTKAEESNIIIYFTDTYSIPSSSESLVKVLTKIP